MSLKMKMISRPLTLLCAAVLVLFIAFSANSVAAQKTGGKTRDLTIITKPAFRNVLRRDIELADADGNLIAEQLYTYLDFKIGSKIYSAFWDSRTTSPPVYLSRSAAYKFLIRPAPENGRRCEIVKIWRRGKLIWANPKFKK